MRLVKIPEDFFRDLDQASARAPRATQKGKPLLHLRAEKGPGSHNSLTMTYFHTGDRTIIGAKSFHCPVRDGKEWDQLAMVVRHNGWPASGLGLAGEFTESNRS